MNKDDCFLEVTNEDIYREIRALREDIGLLKTKAKVNTWIGSTALTLVTGLILGMVLT